MKANPQSFFGVAAFLLSTASCLAQPVASDDAVITERGPHHRVWERIEHEETLGRTVERKRGYLELETGMHFLKEGKWVESKAEIELLEDGGAATNLQHHVRFAANLNTAGAVDLTTPDGKRLRTRILGLSYFDGSTGKSALIAETKDSIGLVVGTDRVLYTNAFDDVDATVEYVVTKAGLSQNIILRSQLPSPAEWELNPQSSRLQVLTEFYDPPEPVKATENRETGLPDEFLDFGEMKIGRGYAFTVGEEIESNRLTPVSKQWGTLEGRTFLIEEVPFTEVHEQIEALSPRRRGASLPRNRVGQGETMMAALKSVLPKRTEQTSKGRMRFASLEKNQLAGFVLDYTITLTSATNFTFKGDHTHHVTGTVNLSGTTTFEGGAVVKYDVSTSATVIASNTVWLTDRYLPVIFTSKNDNSVGEDISGSTGNPAASFAGNIALDLRSHLNPAISNARFSYLSNAICGTNIMLHNAQVIQCDSVFAPASATFHLRNVLGYKLGTLQKQSCGGCTPATVTAQNVTLRYVTNFISAITNASIALTNCLFTAVSNLQPATVSTNYSYILSSDAGIFQIVSGGNHYLADNSPYRNIGTTNIAAQLLADLRKRTTYPPIAFTNIAITNVSSLSAQAQRDTDIPDLGYHYDPLDYVFGKCDMNLDCTLQPGTAVGWFRHDSGWNKVGHGIHIADNKILHFDGRLDSPCWFVHQTAVQEQLIGHSGISAGPGGITGWPVAATNSPTLKLRFTRFAGLPIFRNHFRDDNGVLRVNAMDCIFYSGGIGGYVSYNLLTNCFFDRASFWLDGGVVEQGIALRNCTWRGGGLTINRWSGSSHETPVSIRDCSFDATTVDTDDEHDGNASITDYDFNAFLTGANRTTPQGANDVIVSTLDWQSGSLGKFYLPATSALINAGSRGADAAALYHYTTTTDEKREAATQVDIGFHYVSTACGPIDTIWVDDSPLPTGATAYTYGGDSWTWITSSPTPFSDLEAHKSAFVAGAHQHYFEGATATLIVSTGDSLVAYVYLDSSNPPTEVMLQWNNGSWEHRAYWGANSIPWGTDGTASRRYMGALPATGQWVRLEVPASQVGLENQTLSGMAFTLYGGTTTWDFAGKEGGNFCYDTDGDGSPDYWEDANGNGNGGDDATSWQTYNSPNGLTGATPLNIYTPLK